MPLSFPAMAHNDYQIIQNNNMLPIVLLIKNKKPGIWKNPTLLSGILDTAELIWCEYSYLAENAVKLRLWQYYRDKNCEKLVATASRHESVYNRTDEPSVTFHERGGTTVRVMDFCSNKNRERSNPFRCGKSGQFRYFPFHQATAGLPKDHACFGYVLVNADITPSLRYQPFGRKE